MAREQQLKKQEQRVADSWKDVLEGNTKVKGIKEISFNGAFFQIRFATKKEAIDAKKTKYLMKYQYNNEPSISKHKHELIGTP